MTAIQELREIYHEGGLRLVCMEIWLHLVRRGVLAPYIEAVLGKTLHEKIVMAPKIGYWPQIHHPRSFNEKVAYRRLFTDDEIYSKLADKYRVREYVRKTVGEDILIDLYHVTDDPGTILFSESPRQFVVKPTHISSDIRFIKNKSGTDFKNIRSACFDWLSKTGEKPRENTGTQILNLG